MFINVCSYLGVDVNRMLQIYKFQPPELPTGEETPTVTPTKTRGDGIVEDAAPIWVAFVVTGNKCTR